MSANAPSSEPATPEIPVCSRSAQWVAILLVAVAVGLIGSRWIGAHFRARPSELNRDLAHRVDLNKADRTELMQLPGVGPSRADKILAYRKTNGGFQRVEDLRSVDGIGDVTMTRLKQYVSVDDFENDADSSGDAIRLSRKAKPEQPKAAAGATARKPAPDDPIDLNRASISDLQRLPGIGPTLAQRIVDARQKKPFAKVEDLRRVGGIGAKKYEQLKGFVVVE